MPARKEVYKCEICGNIVEILEGAKGKLFCCGQQMKHMEPQTEDWKNEKHVPIAEEHKGGTLVTVGSTLHPMTDEHYIMWIEVINGDYVNRKYLKPGDEPKAAFYVPFKEDLHIREYCNIHGLWENKK